MKKLFYLMLIFPFAACIKEKKQQIMEDIVVKSVTDGQWKITNATIDTHQVTTWFVPYKFQFKADKKVEAINGGNTECTGTWDASAENKTITSYFTNTTSPGLLFLNGTWNITSSTWTTVDAKQTGPNGEIKIIHMDKL